MSVILKEVIQGDLCSWFANLTGELFIQAQPQLIEGDLNAPRPTGLYGMVRIVSIIIHGFDGTSYENQADPDLDLIETVYGHRLLHVSINTFRQGAFDLINLLYTKLQHTSTIEHFNSINLGLVRRSEIRDITLPLSGILEERHQFDLFLHTVASDTEIVTAIETLQIVGKNGDGDTIVTLNLENVE